ncbi:MAG: hypothetical protein BWY63_01314 [Chloroflexi bacterium ADurb.Bin360]|nr:MAG: hypothetical protein BWY63_01314 [Chloroflexi bacterium ADurb.Bin360]
MSHRGILFKIIHDEIGILSQQIIATQRLGPQMFDEDFHLQGEIEQIVLQAILPEMNRAFLRFIIDAELCFLSNPCGFQTWRNIRDRKANHGGFVKIVNNLAI